MILTKKQSIQESMLENGRVCCNVFTTNANYTTYFHCLFSQKNNFGIKEGFSAELEHSVLLIQAEN